MIIFFLSFSILVCFKDEQDIENQGNVIKSLNTVPKCLNYNTTIHIGHTINSTIPMTYVMLLPFGTVVLLVEEKHIIKSCNTSFMFLCFIILIL